MLAVFFVAVKLQHRVNPAIMWLTAAGLEAARIDSDWLVIDEFATRFVDFYSGYLFASQIFALARRLDAMSTVALMADLVIWRVASAMVVEAGYARLPRISRALGFDGPMAVVACGGLLGARECPPSCVVAARIPLSSVSPSSCSWRRRA